MIEAIALAFALAMDAAAVSAARGMFEGEQKGRRGEAVILPLLFGGFQSGMSALGWLLGAWGGAYIVKWDHWIAFVLLAGIGGKMLYDAWRDEPDDDKPQRSGWLLYIVLAIATSIDAAAAGITLPLLHVAPGIAIALIGVVTAACSAVAFLIGRKLGGNRLGIVGGLVLIAISVKILVEHL